LFFFSVWDPDPDSVFRILIQGLFCPKININGKLLKMSIFIALLGFLIHIISKIVKFVQNGLKKYYKEIQYFFYF